MRLARLRFILLRTFWISLIVIILLQLFARFNDSSQSIDEVWEEIFHGDRSLTDEKRIDLIRSQTDLNDQSQIDWIKIFQENFARRLITLNERDEKTNDKYRLRTSDSPQQLSQSTIDIYEETTVFGRPKFCSSKRIFHPQCPFQNCRWTCEKATTNTDHQRRAHVFHHIDIQPQQMHSKLASRSPEDIWILWVDEANRQLTSLNQYRFNWTLSFRQDSEVALATYGLLIPKRRSSSSSSSLSLPSQVIHALERANIVIDDLAVEYRIYTNFRYRQRHALWFVSNCLPQVRLNYYRKLKEYYPIRAFGLCVETKCNRNDHCESDQSYLAMFYLAFESQTCTHYVTEKFWRAISYGMIPIVLGPSKQSYLDLNIPASAFIHVDDFPSAQHLAEHLHRISQNYELYRQYFQWLKQFDVFSKIDDLEPIRMCELCMRLNLQSVNEQRWYTDLHQWHRTGC